MEAFTLAEWCRHTAIYDLLRARLKFYKKGFKLKYLKSWLSIVRKDRQNTRLGKVVTKSWLSDENLLKIFYTNFQQPEFFQFQVNFENEEKLPGKCIKSLLVKITDDLDD